MNQFNTNHPNYQTKGDNHQLITFDFHNNKVRTAAHDNGEIYFCLKDVAGILAIQNHNEIVKNQLDKDGVDKIYLIDSLNRKQEVTFINEPNLYRVIFRSNKAEAKQFQDWVFNDVLPTIRKTGQYQTTPQPSVIIKDYSDQDLQHLKEVYKIPELAKVLGLSEEQTTHRLYQSYPKAEGQPKPLPLIDSQTQQLLNQFWQVISQLNIDQINHAKNPNILAINLPELYNQLGEKLPQRRTMLQALKHSILPKFQTNNQSVNSAITNNTKKCWVFVVNEGEANE